MAIIVSNVKKGGIEIPDINVSIDYEAQGQPITFGAIDKNKYAAFLAIYPYVLAIYGDDGDSVQFGIYTGDAVTFAGETQGQKLFTYSLSLWINEI